MLTLLASDAHDVAEAAGAASEAAGHPVSGATFKALAFLFTAVTVVFSGFMVMSQRDIVRAATALFIALGGVAGIYLFLGAEFLAFVQVMVYVGGTTVLIMFGVMLTARTPVEISRRSPGRVIPALLVVAMILVPLLTFIAGISFPRAETAPQWALGGGESMAPQATRNIGDLLLTNYIAPFIIASFVLLLALVGAAYLVRRREEPVDAEPAEELA